MANLRLEIVFFLKKHSVFFRTSFLRTINDFTFYYYLKNLYSNDIKNQLPNLLTCVCMCVFLCVYVCVFCYTEISHSRYQECTIMTHDSCNMKTVILIFLFCLVFIWNPWCKKKTRKTKTKKGKTRVIEIKTKRRSKWKLKYFSKTICY